MKLTQQQIERIESKLIELTNALNSAGYDDTLDDVVEGIIDDIDREIDEVGGY